MTSIATTPTEPVFPKRLFSEQAIFAACVWAGFTLFVLVLTTVVSFVRPIDVSGWNLAGQPTRWFPFVIGIYLGYTFFPLYVAHGGTRKGYMVQTLTFSLAYSTLLAVLFAISFFIEAAFYGLMGWPQVLHEVQLYTSALDFPMVALQWLLIMMLWLAGGILISAAWYRNPVLGGLGLVAGIFFAGISGMAIGGETGPHLWAYQQLFGGNRPGIVMAVAMHIVSITILMGLSWLAFRDAPMHGKSS